MEDIISKELLISVLNLERSVDSISFVEKWNTIIYFVNGGNEQTINIYELAHKCKEWALEKNMWIMSHSHSMGGNAKLFRGHLSGRLEIDFYSDSETESIFKACQWILDNKDSTNGRA